MKARNLRRLDADLIFPDLHAPYHDKRAWDVFLKFGRALKPRRVRSLGDFGDCFAISAHDKDPRRLLQFQEESKVVRTCRQQVEDLGAEDNGITLGNHEDRLWRYLVQRAPALLDSISIDREWGLTQNGWKVTQYRHHEKIGKLYLTHEAGHAGIHAVHLTGHAFNKSVLFGHTHRFGISYFGDIAGGQHFAASLGWLGDAAEATYLPEAKKAGWQLGFGVVYREPGRNGHIHFQPIPIVDYRCVLDGAIITTRAKA